MNSAAMYIYLDALEECAIPKEGRQRRRRGRRKKRKKIDDEEKKEKKLKSIWREFMTGSRQVLDSMKFKTIVFEKEIGLRGATQTSNI